MDKEQFDRLIECFEKLIKAVQVLHMPVPDPPKFYFQSLTKEELHSLNCIGKKD